MTRVRQATAPRVTLAVDAGGPVAELGRTLEARGLRTSVARTLEDAVRVDGGPVAYAPASPPSPEVAAELAKAAVRAALAHAPVVMLTAFEPATGRQARERAAALAYLQSRGTILCPNPDMWLETLALVAAFGLPDGPRVAVVAPAGSWLALSARALAAERAPLGKRAPLVCHRQEDISLTDIALVERSELSSSTPRRVAQALIVPVVGRAENLVDGSGVALVGLREAIEAATAAGACAQRIAAGLEDPSSAAPSIVDSALFDRTVEQLEGRSGDHETKVLLKAYGVQVTRQAVASTPSHAGRVAKKIGWPVQAKPWSPDARAESDGGPLESEIYSAPELRRAFVAVTSAANQQGADLPAGAPVIIRETPPVGRALRVRIEQLGALGWTAIADIDGRPDPIAAPVPLREFDALAIAAAVEASRAGDPAPDREALAELLRRAAQMAVDHADIFESLDLARIVVAPRGQGAVVVDARASLRAQRARHR